MKSNLIDELKLLELLEADNKRAGSKALFKGLFDKWVCSWALVDGIYIDTGLWQDLTLEEARTIAQDFGETTFMHICCSHNPGHAINKNLHYAKRYAKQELTK